MRVGRVISAAIVGMMMFWIVPSGAQSQRVAKHLEVTTRGGEAAAPANVPANASAVDIALQYFREHATDMGLTAGDIADVGITTSVSAHTGVTHVYLRQRYNGIEVHGADINLNVTAGGLVLGGVGSSFVPDLAAAIENQTPSVPALNALNNALAHVGLTAKSEPTITEGAGSYEVTFSEAGVADQPIRAKLVYERLNSGKVVLSWLIDVLEADGPHWWNVSVDAADGSVLERTDLTVHDAWSGSADGSGSTTPEFGPEGDPVRTALIPYLGVPNSGSYRVFAWPRFDPNHGPRRWAIDPADPIGSPFGWHDTNAAAGPESTETLGNNVDAYLNPANDNVSVPAERVDGGPGLVFDFPLNLAGPHANSTAAAVTNLFYWNNIIHDIAYRYGFDEASGNFQANNNGKFNPPTQSRQQRLRARRGPGRQRHEQRQLLHRHRRPAAADADVPVGAARGLSGPGPDRTRGELLGRACQLRRVSRRQLRDAADRDRRARVAGERLRAAASGFPLAASRSSTPARAIRWSKRRTPRTPARSA